MWGSHTKFFRRRNALLQAKEQAKKRLQKSLKLHLWRVPAEVKMMTALGEKSYNVPARIFMNDLFSNKLRFFSTQSLREGQKVAFTFDFPFPFFIKGTVAWCRPFNLDLEVFSEKEFKYRIQMDFQFDNDFEQERVKDFYEQCYKTYVMR